MQLVTKKTEGKSIEDILEVVEFVDVIVENLLGLLAI